MKKITLPSVATAALALVMASTSNAANKPAKPNDAASKTAADRSAWAPQSLSGTLTIVDRDKK